MVDYPMGIELKRTLSMHMTQAHDSATPVSSTSSHQALPVHQPDHLSYPSAPGPLPCPSKPNPHESSEKVQPAIYTAEYLPRLFLEA